jgi:predicted DNA-binding transcriptional regulator AlpA
MMIPSEHQPVQPALAKLFEKRIWLVKDVSEYTGYAVGTVYNLTSADEIPFRKKRGKLYFIPLEIINWWDEGDLV